MERFPVYFRVFRIVNEASRIFHHTDVGTAQFYEHVHVVLTYIRRLIWTLMPRFAVVTRLDLSALLQTKQGLLHLGHIDRPERGIAVFDERCVYLFRSFWCLGKIVKVLPHLRI